MTLTYNRQVSRRRRP